MRLCACTCHGGDQVEVGADILTETWCFHCSMFHSAVVDGDPLYGMDPYIEVGRIFYSPPLDVPRGGVEIPPPPSVEPAILEPDSDEGTPDMTTTEFPTVPPTLAYTRPDGEVLIARDRDANASLLFRASRDPATTGSVQKAKTAEKTGVLGLYLEAVAHTASGSPFAHMRFFVVDNHLYTYNRNVGDTRANWRHRKVTSLAAALTVVQNVIDKDTVQMFGTPILVELTPDDVSAVETGQMPPARFRGQYRLERDFGKYDFKMEVKSANVPPKLIKALRNNDRYVKPAS
jgi:hypothetical protein